MGKMKYFSVMFLCSLASCSGLAYQDKYYQLDNVSGHELRGDQPVHDRPLSACDPTQASTGGKAYKCVVHFYPDYQKLLDKITELQNQLTACQGKQGS